MKPTNNPAADFRLRDADLDFLMKMPLARSALLKMHHHDRKSYKAIADELGMREGTVKSGLHRARAQLLKLRAAAPEAGGKEAPAP